MKSFLLNILFLITSYDGLSQVDTLGRITTTTKPFVLGVIEEFYSNELGEKRKVNIYLPEGYSEKDTTRYPVIYLLDGSADEDFIHVVGLIQFNTFSWVNRLPKPIVVGIETVDRRRDFTFPTSIIDEKKAYPTAGHSERFISFLQKDLLPFIDAKYKTNAERMLIGQSLGGLLVSEILLRNCKLFNKYILISPSVWWDARSILKQEFLKPNTQSLETTKVYIAVGDEGHTPGKNPRLMIDDVKELSENIKKSGASVYLDYISKEDHATIAHQAIYNALIKLFNSSR